jgi:glycosyltransferase involved in cell wall biosynthesis
MLFVNRDSEIGGGVTYMIHVASALMARGWEVDMLAPRGPALPRLQGSGMKWINGRIFHPIQAGKVAKIIERGGYDVVSITAYTVARATVLACKKLGVPVYNTMHGPAPEKRHEEWGRLYPDLDSIVVLNEFIYQHYLDRGLKESKLCLSRIITPWRAEPPQKNGSSFLYCSRLSKTKGTQCRQFLQAALKFKPDEIVVVGDGSMRKELTREFPSVHFVGATNETQQYFDRATLAAGAGYVAVESIEAGAAVVGMGFSGCLGAVTEHDYGWMVSRNFGDHAGPKRAHDPAQLEHDIERAMAVYQSGEAKVVRQLAEYEFSLDAVGNQLDGFLRRLAKKESFADLSHPRYTNDFSQVRPS